MTSDAEYSRRFWSRVSGGDVSECWLWTRGKTADGYGQFYYVAGNVRAHRWAFEDLRSPIPDSLHLDHLCRNRACVNPWHLEPVTPRVNSQRGETGQHMRQRAASRTECSSGHPWTPENVYVGPSGQRACRECARDRDRRRTRRLEAAARAAERATWSCGVDGCDNPYSTKGYCKMHAERVRRNGHPYLQSEVAA